MVFEIIREIKRSSKITIWKKVTIKFEKGPIDCAKLEQIFFSKGQRKMEKQSHCCNPFKLGPNVIKAVLVQRKMEPEVERRY